MHDIKHRSCGAFGDSVAGVGFCLIVFSIFLFIVPKLSVIICLLMLAAGVPLVIVGIRVARWNKTEEPKMTKIDPALSYRYLLCIGDKEEPLDLVELILRNWGRAAEYKNAIHIRKTANPKDILSTVGKTDQVYVPNYDERETAW